MKRIIMRRRIIACGVIVLAIVAMIIFAGCEETSGGYKQLFDTTYNFDRVQIKMPDGEVIKGAVDSWRDFEDGDQLQVVVNGVTYLTHATNVVLMKDGR